MVRSSRFRAGPYVAGSVIVAAGLYELTPLKQRSLRRCRAAPPSRNALRCGLAHGLDCVGCSGALMALLFAVGVMSLFWMAVVAAAVFLEKVAPHGDRLIGPIALVLIGLGVWVALGGLVHPASGM